MCENSKGPPESRKPQVDGQRSAAAVLDSSLFNGESPVQISERTRALYCDVWEAFLDKDGRVVNESALRKAVFKGGIDCKIRKEVWSFLFGLYPFSSTRREREALAAENVARYQALKMRWKELVKTYQPRLQPDTPESIPLYLRECRSLHVNNEQTEAVRERLSGAAVEEEASHMGDDQLVFLNLTAKLHADRQPVDIGKLHSSIRVIDKDVPRTDRGQVYFEGKGNQNLLVLRDILITYSAYHQDVGYVQGMNDILSRFLIVLGSETHAYWCFANYMETVKSDFLDDGMLNKIKHVRLLLRKMDEQLYNHFEAHEMGDMLFVHRWLVLTFKREFSFGDALTMFEIISSQHLELSSMEAEQERERQRAKELEKDGGEFHVQVVDMNTNYSFEVFVCLAVLKEYRNKLLKCLEISSVYNTIHSLSMKMDLNIILMRAEELF
ncbi:hypothetical protein OS493_003482 [Desmophyllum pertusum]|uniref:Rab-GAP TBC domain-containing protein n=1 Tax=Desmophyllum pertusum TaxID=174260 RepID=A0A9X0A5H5_9CNID|nr:hypothetical protein OS493_003482 [Desmophyllum pertusum]